MMSIVSRPVRSRDRVYSEVQERLVVVMKRVSLVLRDSASLYFHHFLLERQLIAQYSYGMGDVRSNGKVKDEV